MTDLRTLRSEQRAVKAAKLRKRADAMAQEAGNLRATTNSDPAFWTQPAYGNSAGRAFAARRERERVKSRKAAELAVKADELRKQADVLEADSAVVAGDAAARREAKILNMQVHVGQMVKTIYGVHPVAKVNKKSVSVSVGCDRCINISKHLIFSA